MLSTLDLSDLLAPVVFRAQADISTRIRGFSDRFAAFVLERLEVNPDVVDYGYASVSQQHQLARCAWIDRQICKFLMANPEAEGIEVLGGLSTRFHRLSAQLDWPQFYWRAINTSEVNDCLQYVFPALDNHRSIGCEEPLHYWNKTIQWDDGKPKIIVYGEQNPLENKLELDSLYTDIERSLSKQAPYVDLIITHNFDDVSASWSTQNLMIHVVATQERPQKKFKFLNYLVGLFTRNAQAHIRSSHLRVSRRHL